MNFSLHTCLKQYRMAAGGVLLIIAITACNTSAKSQPPSSAPSVASSFESKPTLPLPSPPSPVSLSQNATDVEPLQQEAVQVIRDYYRAIAQRNYQQAYSAWEGNGTASQQSFEQFQQGFANTACVAVEVGSPGRLDGAAGSSYIEIPVTVTAITKDGTPQRFHGSYVLRRVNNVPGSTPEQRRWHLYSADITPIS
ncbi:MAG TPA: hypothetical protein V6C78_26505 [Crinalium sp.]|jgi:hypothetical protein